MKSMGKNSSVAISEEPWQLKMFRRSLKKQQKLEALLNILGDVDGLRCLLITSGDNNGALNWHFKQHGGTWTWVDTEKQSIEQIGKLTGDPVALLDKQALALPFEDASFDVIVTIDVHEHLEHPGRLNEELARLVSPGGTVVATTPNGDQSKLANRMKKLVGMRVEDYGHVVTGYDVPELQEQLGAVGLVPYREGSYSRFFTELIELMINFAYVKVLSRRSQAGVERGQIAPQNEDQLKSVDKTYKLYSTLYPFMSAFSRLDVLDRSDRGYAVIVAARKG